MDFLGRLDNSLENLAHVVREVCEAEVAPDGMVFEPDTVKAERINEDADYEGVRVRFIGLLGKAKASMQIDVGFGDIVTTSAESITYPSLLDFPASELAGYPRETVIAEKFQAMVYLRTANSRMKDFYDVWLLARQFSFDGPVLAKAITATFAKRQTGIDVNPIAFTPEFTEQASTIVQWRAFRARLGIDEVPERLADIVGVLTKSWCRWRARVRQRFRLRHAMAPGGTLEIEQVWKRDAPGLSFAPHRLQLLASPRSGAHVGICVDEKLA